MAWCRVLVNNWGQFKHGIGVRISESCCRTVRRGSARRLVHFRDCGNGVAGGRRSSHSRLLSVMMAGRKVLVDTIDKSSEMSYDLSFSTLEYFVVA